MAIKEVIQTINRMQADGLIDRYAIGGAVGATFYLEPVATLDVDVFVTFGEAKEHLVNLEPIFNYLKAHGGRIEGQHMVIADWPVQFFPADTPLLQEALTTAAEKNVEGTPARVFTAEHIAAVALETGRAKDKARVLQFVESGALDQKRFEDILGRHGLSVQWQKFERQFLH